MSSLPDYFPPSDDVVSPADEYTVVVCENFLRLTATAWVQMPDYDDHPKAFKELFMTFLIATDESLGDKEILAAKKQSVYDAFDTAYDERVLKEFIDDADILEAESSTPLPSNKVKGKARAVDEVPLSREQTPPPLNADKGKARAVDEVPSSRGQTPAPLVRLSKGKKKTAVDRGQMSSTPADLAEPTKKNEAKCTPAPVENPPPAEKPPLDIAKKTQMFNEKAATEIMEKWIRNTAGSKKEKKIHDVETVDPDIEYIDPADGQLDKSLFMRKAGGPKAGSSRVKNQKQENKSKKRKPVSDAASPEQTDRQKRKKPADTCSESDRATSTITEFDPKVHGVLGAKEATPSEEYAAPTSPLEALEVLIALTREANRHAKTSADTVASIQTTLGDYLPKIAHSVAETSRNTEDIHLSMETIYLTIDNYFSGLVDHPMNKPEL